MPAWLQLSLIALTAGSAMPLGGFLASRKNVLPRWLEAELRHTIVAAGGGVLIAAVALVLVPEGSARTSPLLASACVLAGGVFTLFVDRALARHGGHFGMLTAMLLDYLPESLALGALFVDKGSAVVLLGILIGVQNLPEGFNAQRELQRAGMPPRRILWFFFALTPLGPLLALLGWQALAEQPELLGGTLLFAAGGILYLTFQDIAPQVPLKNRWAPPLGAVAGFIIGLAGNMLLN